MLIVIALPFACTMQAGGNQNGERYADPEGSSGDCTAGRFRHAPRHSTGQTEGYQIRYNVGGYSWRFNDLDAVARLQRQNAQNVAQSATFLLDFVHVCGYN